MAAAATSVGQKDAPHRNSDADQPGRLALLYIDAFSHSSDSVLIPMPNRWADLAEQLPMSLRTLAVGRSPRLSQLIRFVDREVAIGTKAADVFEWPHATATVHRAQFDREESVKSGKVVCQLRYLPSAAAHMHACGGGPGSLIGDERLFARLPDMAIIIVKFLLPGERDSHNAIAAAAAPVPPLPIPAASHSNVIDCTLSPPVPPPPPAASSNSARVNPAGRDRAGGVISSPPPSYAESLLSSPIRQSSQCHQPAQWPGARLPAVSVPVHAPPAAAAAHANVDATRSAQHRLAATKPSFEASFVSRWDAPDRNRYAPAASAAAAASASASSRVSESNSKKRLRHATFANTDESDSESHESDELWESSGSKRAKPKLNPPSTSRSTVSTMRRSNAESSTRSSLSRCSSGSSVRLPAFPSSLTHCEFGFRRPGRPTPAAEADSQFELQWGEIEEEEEDEDEDDDFDADE